MKIIKCGHRSTGYDVKDFDPKVIAKGLGFEVEHTCDLEKAKRIVMDHVAELGDQYYDELEKLENRLKAKNKELPDKRKRTIKKK
jgi:hypothetical protein